MKELLIKIFNFLMAPSNKVNEGIFMLIALIGIVAGKTLGPGVGLVLGSVLIVLLLVYIVKLVIERKKDGQVKIIFFGVLMSILIIIINYFELRKINEDLLMPFIPVTLMLFSISIYKVVLKSKDEEIIKKVKLGMIMSMPALIIMFVLMVYANIFL